MFFGLIILLFMQKKVNKMLDNSDIFLYNTNMVNLSNGYSLFFACFILLHLCFGYSFYRILPGKSIERKVNILFSLELFEVLRDKLTSWFLKNSFNFEDGMT